MIRDEHASARAAVLRALAGVSGASTAALVRATGLSQDRVRSALSGLSQRPRQPHVASTGCRRSGRRGSAGGEWSITDAGREALAKLGDVPAPAEPAPRRLPVVNADERTYMVPIPDCEAVTAQREDCARYDECLRVFVRSYAGHARCGSKLARCRWHEQPEAERATSYTYAGGRSSYDAAIYAGGS